MSEDAYVRAIEFGEADDDAWADACQTVEAAIRAEAQQELAARVLPWLEWLRDKWAMYADQQEEMQSWPNTDAAHTYGRGLGHAYNDAAQDRTLHDVIEVLRALVEPVAEVRDGS